MNKYCGVVVRTIDKSERRREVQDPETPLVIEPLDSPSANFLIEFLRHYSHALLADMANYGAVLLRGFELRSVGDFERQVLSIYQMRGMSDVLMSETGRTLVENTQCVLYTNTVSKTGGGLDFGGFHSENYFVPDVPRFISLFCETPSVRGGETGLVNTSKVFSDLAQALRHKLEKRACIAAVYSLYDIATRYNIPVEVASEFLSKLGLPVIILDGAPYMAVYKPSVMKHPATGEHSLMINFMVIPGIQRALIREFLPDYSSIHWWQHRLLWKLPWLESLSTPRQTLRASWRRVRQRSERREAIRAQLSSICGPFVHEHFSPDDVETLSVSMRNRYVSFFWRQGDLLLIDNLKMAHGGMPGVGARSLKAIISNPLDLPRTKDAPGLCTSDPTARPLQCIGAQLTQLSRSFDLP